jgi:hypothetical protein
MIEARWPEAAGMGDHAARGRAGLPFGANSSARAALGLWAALLLASGCAGSRLACQWTNRPLTVDGDLAKWQGTLYAFDDDREFVGVKNDGASFYLCLATDHQDLQRQILFQGLTCWIDPTGGKEKVLGIHFPLGLRASRPEPGGPRPRFEPQAAVLALGDSSAVLEILNGPGPGKRIPVRSVAGLGIKVGWKDDMMIYELRVPLESDSAHPYAVGALPGKTISLRWESPKLVQGGPAGMEGRRERGDWSDNQSGDRPDGGPDDSGKGEGGRFPGGGRHGMGGPGGFHGGFGGGRRGVPEPLQIWVKVALAGREEKPAM